VAGQVDFEHNPAHLYVDEHGESFLVLPPACFVNHSCDPNAYSKDDGGVISLFALKRIEPGQEICFHYSVNGRSDWEMVCACKSDYCTRRITGNFHKLPEWQKRRLQKALKGHLRLD